ncbi:MAG: thioesterase [Bacteroidetes bacterium HGW-Bacteroidetes-4]|jgi:acyl-CoA thioesterase FadM|nr:MAG: thioesterase [Bacteroidetes bacterium HGW-Bacteroidetes-4]
MEIKGVQDFYSDEFAHCYGCGRLNHDGFQIKTRWEGDETVSVYTPRKYHTAMEGFVYGGLLASLIDCHGTGSGALAYAREHGIELTEYNAPRFVTGSLTVNYKKPTPIEGPLEIRGKIKEIKGRKVISEINLWAGGEICVTGEVLAVLIPENFGK